METISPSAAKASTVPRRLDEPVLQSAEDAVRTEGSSPRQRAPWGPSRLTGIVDKVSSGVGARPGRAALLAALAGAAVMVLARGVWHRSGPRAGRGPGAF